MKAGFGGVLAGALSLIVLQALGSGSGPERGGALLVWISQGVQQIISPTKAAIPNVAKAGPAPKGQVESSGNTMPRNPELST